MKKCRWLLYVFSFVALIGILASSGCVYFSSYDDAILTVFTQPILFGHTFLTAPGSDLAFPNSILLHLSSQLSANIKGVNGYGLLILVADVFWILSFFSFFIRSIRSGEKLLREKLVFFSFLFIVLLPVHFFLINYTSQAVLHSGLGMTLLMCNIKDGFRGLDRKYIVLAFIHLFIGFLLRYQAAILISFILILSALIRGEIRPSAYVKLLVPFTVLLLLPLLGNIKANKEERRRIEFFNTYNFRANDTYLTNAFAKGDSVNNIKLSALTSWGVLDAKVADERFLQRATGPTADRSFINYFLTKIKLAYTALSQYDSFTPSLNLRHIIFAYLIFLIIAISAFRGSQAYLPIYIDLLVFTSILIGFALLLKWEFRLLSPVILIYILAFSLTSSPSGFSEKYQFRRYYRWLDGVLLLALIALFFSSSVALVDSIKAKRQEQSDADAVLNELKAAYPGSTFVLDLNSLVLPGLHVVSAFENTKQDAFISTGEYWTYFYDEFRDYYQAKYRSYSLDNIYIHLCHDPDTYFIYNSNFKTPFTEQYLHLIYNRDIRFLEAARLPALGRDIHLFFPVAYHFKLYKANCTEPNS